MYHSLPAPAHYSAHRGMNSWSAVQERPVGQERQAQEQHWRLARWALMSMRVKLAPEEFVGQLILHIIVCDRFENEVIRT
jgi:hypothetical protein